MKIGYKHSEETRKRLSLSHIGKKQSLEQIAKRMANPNVARTLFKKGHSHSPEVLEKLSKSLKGMNPWNKGLKGWRAGEKHDWMPVGEKHWHYKKDRSTLAKKQERNDGAYIEWRKQVWTRDSYKCNIDNIDCCGKIEAHHILGWAEYPELRYDIKNGITLCHYHHPRKREEEKRLSPFFQNIINNLK